MAHLREHHMSFGSRSKNMTPRYLVTTVWLRSSLMIGKDCHSGCEKLT